jgi:hypothetical protein
MTMRRLGVVAGAVIVTGCIATGCSPSSGTATGHLTSRQSSASACSLLSGSEATKLLGGPSVAPADLSASLCTFVGPAGSSILLQLMKSHSLPQCSDPAKCESSGAQRIVVDGVSAEWEPASSQPSNGDALANILVFTHGEYFVNLDVERVSHPEALAEKAMMFIIKRL